MIIEDDSSCKISTRRLLLQSGFTPVGDGFVFDLGNCTLEICQSFNQYFEKGFMVLGYTRSTRTIGYIDFFLPSQFDSYELGLAVIAYNLRSYEFEIKPDWLIDGLALRDHLPWVKEQNAFLKIPKALIDHEWFRILVKKLRVIASEAQKDDTTSFFFDGEKLQVVSSKENFIIGCSGNPWEKIVNINTDRLSSLPNRIKKTELFDLFDLY